jgi:hypothetical protein
LQRDRQHRLHCETGPAVAYPDGWELYFWHGQQIPGSFIRKRDELDPALALTWHNLEHRRVLCEIIGWDRVLQRVGTRVIHDSGDPSIGTLLECDLPGVGRLHFFRVRCGTGRTFVLSVPRGCRNAREANAWTYGLQAEQYVPEVRT